MTNVVAVVFAHNEELPIVTTLNILNKFKQEGRINEIIVINDGSTDKTATSARILGARIITHKENLGKREGFISGAKEAKRLGADVMLSLDADIKEFPRETLISMIEKVTTGKKLMSIAQQHEVHPFDSKNGGKVESLHSNAQRAINIKALDPLFRGDLKWWGALKSKRLRNKVFSNNAGKGSKWGLEYALNELIPKNKTVLLKEPIITQAPFRKDKYYDYATNVYQIIGRRIVQQVRFSRQNKAAALKQIKKKPQLWGAAKAKQLRKKRIARKVIARRMLK
jgi:glycosyltransferase involved in cell wall biosynthesis